MARAFRIILQGTQEVPSNASGAFGIGAFVYDDATTVLSYNIDITGLDFGDIFDGGADETPATGDNVTAGHIHNAASGVNGGVVFNLFNQDPEFVQFENSDGTRRLLGNWGPTDAPSITPFASQFANAVVGNEVSFYMNIHTTGRAGGEIRGQLVTIADDTDNTVDGTTNNDTLPGLGGNDTINGFAGLDTLTGGDGNDRLDGGLGADRMIGNKGNDTYVVDDVADVTIDEAGTADTIETTLASLTLAADIERLVFTDTGNHVGRGNSGDNRLNGNAGLDKFIIDAAGSDIFSGGQGEDSFDGRSSALGLVVRLDNQALNAGAVAGDTFASIEKFFGSNTADDTMQTGAARAKFSGFGGNDTLTGGTSIDQLQGGVGNDTLAGLAASDSLDGGAGNDTMTGGTGADLFVYSAAGFGQDTITDFESGLDRFKVNASVATAISDYTITGNGSTAVTLALVADPNQTIAVHGSGGSNLTVTAADFVFY